MLKVAVLVSGGGTDLQRSSHAIDNGTITNAEVSVVIVTTGMRTPWSARESIISRRSAYHQRIIRNRAAFNQAFLKKLDSYAVDLVVLPAFLVVHRK